MSVVPWTPTKVVGVEDSLLWAIPVAAIGILCLLCCVVCRAEPKKDEVILTGGFKVSINHGSQSKRS